MREGSLEAPTRHALDWDSPGFNDEQQLLAEMERVFDVCHGCRRCHSLCNSFPTLFDLVDGSPSMEVDGVDKQDYARVVDQCYLCDLCFQTKCPYVPPHDWAIDFPHLMLRAKAVKFRREGAPLRDRVLASTDAVGRLAGIPVVVHAVNAANRNATARKVVDKLLGVHPDAPVPEYHSDTLRKRLARRTDRAPAAEPTPLTTGRVALFATCYCNRNEPDIGEDLVAVFAHNGIPVTPVTDERCCGMPKMELGDLDSVRALKEFNVPRLAALVDSGHDLVAPVPSCVLMYKQELPLLFPDDADVARVRDAMYDPFEYLMLRHRAGKLRTDFANALGTVSYHVACHLRVQNIGLKTRELLQLVPGTTIDVIERCSGHDGTYGVKTATYEAARRIARPVVKRVRDAAPDHYASDCPMAGRQIEHGLDGARPPEHPLKLLRLAYGI